MKFVLFFTNLVAREMINSIPSYGDVCSTEGLLVCVHHGTSAFCTATKSAGRRNLPSHRRRLKRFCDATKCIIAFTLPSPINTLMTASAAYDECINIYSRLGLLRFPRQDHCSCALTATGTLSSYQPTITTAPKPKQESKSKPQRPYKPTTQLS